MGLKIGLKLDEVRVLKLGEILDLAACNAVYNGNADFAPEELSYKDIMAIK